MNLRVFHRRIAIIFSPFLILSALTGIALLFRKDDLYGKETKSFLIGLHNWEIAAKYIGIILALGLIGICISGLMLFFKMKRF